MRWAAAGALIAVWMAASISSGSPQAALSQRAFLEKYCLTCHSETSRKKMQPKASEAGADGVVLVKRSSGGLNNTTPPFGHPSSTEEGSL